MKGLDPPRLAALDPKSSAATNYATSASFVFAVQRYVVFFICATLFVKKNLKKLNLIQNSLKIKEINLI